MSERFSTKNKQADPNIELLKSIDAQGTAKVPKVDHDARHNNKGHMFYIGAGAIAASVVTAGLMVGPKLISNDVEPPVFEPEESSPKTPGEWANNVESEIEGISTETHTNPREIATAYIDKKNYWINHGATEEYEDNRYEYKDSDGGHLNTEEYARAVAAETDDKYKEVLLAEGWESNPIIVDLVSNIDEIHAGTLYMYGITNSTNSEDLATYSRYSTVDDIDVVKTSPSEMIVDISTSDNDNRDQNRAAEYLADTDFNEKFGTTQYTFVPEDGVWKVSNITVLE